LTVAFAILDTNVYIDHWERGAHAAELDLVRQSLVVRHSAVVLSELRRGVRSLKARRTVEALRRVANTVWAPTAADWWDAGEIVAKIGSRLGWEVAKKREFQRFELAPTNVIHCGPPF